MAILHIFKPFEAEGKHNTFSDLHVSSTNRVISYSVRKNRFSVGEFSIVLPLSLDVSKNIKYDYNLYLKTNKREYWLIVRGIHVSKKDGTVTVTGTDAKGFLNYRIALFKDDEALDGTQGFDVVKGTTEYCCVHYVKNNVADPINGETSDIILQRIIPRLVLAPKYVSFEPANGIGIPNDTYMARFEPIDEIIQKLSENANINWDVRGNFSDECFYFEMSKPVDRSVNQNVRAPVVFGTNFKNINEFSYESSNSNLKNAFYSTKAGGTLESDALTVLVTRETSEPTGVYRKEHHLNVSCDTTDEISTYALHDAQDLIATESVKASVLAFEAYENGAFDVGDKVTLYDKELNLQLDTYLTSITVSEGKKNMSFAITLGDEEVKPFQKIYNTIKNKGV